MSEMDETRTATMSQAQAQEARRQPRAKRAISPELSEILHMLKSLEAELALKKAG
ncbi:hypothetical protein [Aestuariivirga sp.]|uniref:hypothetical protein n=1 Tax=Aestuariivirga sp. TaxID=2650926 RepID=UPI00391964E2